VNPFDCAPATAGRQGQAPDLIPDSHPEENALARFLWACLMSPMVSRQNIKRYCNAIAAAFKPERIILFGSHANGQADENSDVDVLVVMRNARRLGRHPAAAIRMKVRSDFPVDMLVRDEREVARRVKQRDLFMLEITERGRVMYEPVHA
jgi:predicted nucleotidyltransferase